MEFTVRPYEPAGPDLQRIVALIQDTWNPRWPLTNLHVGDVLWRLRDPVYEQQLYLWADARGELAGFTGWDGTFLDYQFHQRWAGSGLMARMLDWAEEHPTPGQPVTTYANEADPSLVALLEARGYQRQEQGVNYHTRSLGSDLPNGYNAMPDGYSVRHLHGPEEIEARVRGHQEGWQTTKLKVEMYQRLMVMPGYRTDLDTVVVAPDGTFVATCNCWLDERSKAGLFEPVSTHPDHRRRGLGRALVFYGLTQLRALGAETAWVISMFNNPASTRLYESCGMAVVRRDYDYLKTLS